MKEKHFFGGYIRIRWHVDDARMLATHPVSCHYTATIPFFYIEISMNPHAHTSYEFSNWYNCHQHFEYGSNVARCRNDNDGRRLLLPLKLCETSDKTSDNLCAGNAARFNKRNALCYCVYCIFCQWMGTVQPPPEYVYARFLSVAQPHIHHGLFITGITHTLNSPPLPFVRPFDCAIVHRFVPFVLFVKNEFSKSN